MPASAVAITESFEAVLERITDAVFALDANWRFTYVNAAATRIFKTTAEELIGQEIWTVFPNAVGNDAYDHYHYAMTTGKSVEFEAFCTTLQRWVRECVYPSADGLTVYFTDITAQRQAKEEGIARLVENEERLRMVSDFTYDLEYWRGPDGDLRYISPSCERITGYPDTDFQADPSLLERIVHPEDRRMVLCHFAKEMVTKETYALDFRIIHRDDRVRWINHACQPVYDANGYFQGRRGSNRDITERKEVEAELERERALLTAVLEQLPVGVVIAEAPSGSIIRGNAHMEQLCTHAIHPSADAAEQCDHRMSHRDGTPYRPDELPLARVIDNGEVIINEEMCLQAEDGLSQVLLVSAVPVRDEQKKVIAAVVVSHDITAIKELDHAKDEFLAILSHELKTPLTCILGWSEFAIDQSSVESLRQAMAIIYRNARRQQRLIDELLDMSRLQHQRMDCVMEPTDLGHLTCQAVERGMEAAEKAGVTLTLAPFGEALPINADPRRLALCIDHLLWNGIKFTSSGGKVSVSCRHDGEIATLTVQDTGRGIAPDVLPTVFTPFRQLDRDEAVGGLGLGLAIVRGIVKIHHGRVTAGSPGVGQGSTFTVELPLMKKMK